MSTVAHRCPICRASLNFESNPPTASGVGRSGVPPSIAINPPSALPAAITDNGTEFIAAQRLVPTSSLSSDMIRRTFGGRVLVALTTRHLQQTAIETQSLPPPVVRPATQWTAVAVLNGESDVMAGGQRRNIRRDAPAPSAGRDAQLHAVLDYWYPADNSNEVVTQTAPPTSSSIPSTRALPSAIPEVMPSCPTLAVDSEESRAGDPPQAVRRQRKRKRALSSLVEPGNSLDGTSAVSRRSSRRISSNNQRLEQPHEGIESE